MKNSEYAAQIEKAFNKGDCVYGKSRTLNVSGTKIIISVSEFHCHSESSDYFKVEFHALGSLENQFYFEVIFNIHEANTIGLEEYLKTSFIPNIKAEASKKIIEIEERNEVYIKSKEIFSEYLNKE
ncbi:hypothetical protein HB162lentus_02270 [Mammaliicoccus lentus]